MSDTISREAAVKTATDFSDSLVQEEYEKMVSALRALPAAPAPWTEEELADALADTEHATIVYRERYKSWHLTPEHALRLARVALARPLARPTSEGEERGAREGAVANQTLTDAQLQDLANIAPVTLAVNGNPRYAITSRHLVYEIQTLRETQRKYGRLVRVVGGDLDEALGRIQQPTGDPKYVCSCGDPYCGCRGKPTSEALRPGENRIVRRLMQVLKIEPCRDHSCVQGGSPVKGMGTNGGCRCADSVESAVFDLMQRSHPTRERKKP